MTGRLGGYRDGNGHPRRGAAGAQVRHHASDAEGHIRSGGSRWRRHLARRRCGGSPGAGLARAGAGPTTATGPATAADAGTGGDAATTSHPGAAAVPATRGYRPAAGFAAASGLHAAAGHAASPGDGTTPGHGTSAGYPASPGHAAAGRPAPARDRATVPGTFAATRRRPAAARRL